MSLMERLELELGRRWTPEDLDLLDVPDGWWKLVEIADGTLEVTPSPAPPHERILALLNRLLVRAAPDGYLVHSGNLGIAFDDSYRIPDLTVLREDLPIADRRFFAPGDVLLAVEIVSPSTRTRDRVTKPAQYAAAGIPNFWRVEPDPLTLVAYRLAGDAYDEVGSWAAGETARLSEPFAVDVEVSALDPAGGRRR